MQSSHIIGLFKTCLKVKSVFRHRAGTERRFPGLPRAGRRETLVEKQILRYFNNKKGWVVGGWGQKDTRRSKHSINYYKNSESKLLKKFFVDTWF